MTWPNSSIGMKLVMAITGIVLFGFVVAHLIDNLTVYGGPDVMNEFAMRLHQFESLLWVMRIGLIVAVLAHIASSVKLTEKNRAARPVAYAHDATVRASWTSRTMLASGMMVLAYVIYHLLHFTFRTTNPEISHLIDAQGRHDVYSMVVRSFQQPLISITYVAAMVLLGFHLNHGIASFFQTLGLNHPRYTPLINKAGPVLGALIVLGYISIPLSVMFGVLEPGAAGAAGAAGAHGAGAGAMPVAH
jgi:succinate dehydrogenase cytochrome b subunit